MEISAERLAADIELLKCGCGEVFVAKPALIRLRGADCREWLQGQATNDLRLLSPEHPISFCLCTPTGQLEAIVDAWEEAGEILLSCPMESRHILLNRVEEMVIMEDVEAIDLTDHLHFASVQGPMSTPISTGLSLPIDRSGGNGFDLWNEAPLALDLPPVASESLEAARIAAGIPLFGADTTEKTLPPELGPQFEARHVSYTKGCYTGQEILHRIHSRGHTNKVWVGFSAEAELERGASIDAADHRAIGTVSSIANHPELGWIGAGTVRNAFAAPGTLLTVQTERGDVMVEVKPFPLV